MIRSGATPTGPSRPGCPTVRPAGSGSTVDRRPVRRRDHRRRSPSPATIGCPASCCPASPTPTACLPPGAARPDPRRRRHVLDLAGAMYGGRPARPGPLLRRWPGRCTPRWCWPAYTAVGEFHYLHHDHDGRPYADPNAMSRGAGRRGRRRRDPAHAARHLLPQRRADPTGHEPLDPVQRRFSDGGRRAPGRRGSTAADAPARRGRGAVHSVRAVPAEQLARRRWPAPGSTGRCTSTSASSRPRTRPTLAHYGRTPTELLDGTGVLGPRTTAVHATHLTAADIDRLGRSRTSACFCPTTERDLADGIGPARGAVGAGAPLSLGSDQHAVIDCSRSCAGWRCTSGWQPASAAGSPRRS